MQDLQNGDIAPGFQGNSNKGMISLESFRGKNVILYFYPKDMTPGCTIQARDFSAYYDTFKELNVEIIGVSQDSLDRHHKFCDQENILYYLVSDTDHIICKSYNIMRNKTLFGKKFLSINRSTFIINTQGKILHIWKNVKPIGHTQKVLEKIKTFQSISML